MSIINTKAGWQCQEDFFIDEAGLCGTRNDNTFKKTNDGAAICARYVYNDTNNVILVSPVESYTSATYADVITNVVTISATIDDTIWYGTYYSNGANNWTTGYPDVEGTVAISSADAETVLGEIITAAQVQFGALPIGTKVKDLATVDYIKTLLSRVLTENNTRMFTQVQSMIDAHSGNVDYSTTEQDTGIKWLDGKSVYQKTYVFNPPVAGGGNNYVLAADVSGLSIDTLISISGVQHDQDGNYIMSLEAYSNVGDNMYLRADKSAVMWKSYYLLDWMTIKYTKVTT